MNRAEYLWYSSEITTLEELLRDIPEENVIERMGFESRLKEARAAIEGVTVPVSQRLKLTFRGQPVIGETYGIYADFAGQALNKFTDAVAAIVASLKDKLSGSRGRIPEKQQNQLLVVGPAIGSFGFELELPASAENRLFEDLHVSGESVKKIQAIFKAITEGDDEDLSEFIDEIRPRAIGKVYEFLDYQIQNGAWCGLDYDGHVFRFQNEGQLKESARRLAKDNITEKEVSFTGTLIGVMPSTRQFELEISIENIIKGKTYLSLEDGKALLGYAMKPVKITLNERRVGEGNPRYVLEHLENVALADSANS